MSSCSRRNASGIAGTNYVSDMAQFTPRPSDGVRRRRDDTMADTRPEFHNALYQSGHAVAAHAVELPFGHVSLEQDEQSLGYLLHSSDPASTWGRDAPDRIATVAVAGRVALELYAGTVPDDHLEWPDRWVTAADVAKHRARAREILTACWPAVTSIADLLITRERVTSMDVQLIIRSIAPDMERPVPYDEHSGVSGVRRPAGAADSEDTADAMPDGASVGGVDEGGGD